jgi:DNA polymerase-3 subunit gamma/tau
VTYQSLYRRHRPRRFAEVRGQEHVVRALRNAVREDRVGHAYLFSGPRGTGKTTSARILAKVLNCERPVDGEPCCECSSCLAVEGGTSFDVHELDAASNNGVDAMRELVERASLGTPGRRRVYILDEVHMLSRPAEAALLKTLEEPPAHVVFVLATTDPQKVSATIRSRTQHLEFRLLGAETLDQLVRDVATTDGLEVTPDAIEAVVRQGAGSARDVLSALDQVLAAGGTVEESEPLDEIVEALISEDTARALGAVAVAIDAGRDPRTLTEHLVAHLRDAFLSLMNPQLVRLPDRMATTVAEQAQRLGAAATVRAMEVLGETLVDLRHAPDPRLLLDIALVRLTRRDADVSASALLARIERLERALAGRPGAGSTPTTQPPSTEPAAAPRVSATQPPAAAEQPAAAPGNRATGRATLGARAGRGGDNAAPPPAVGTGTAEPTTTPSPIASAPPGEASAPTPASPPTAASSPAVPAPPTDADVAVPFPSRDALTLAWADHVVPRLKGMARALYLPGRFVASDGAVAVFALPNQQQIAKCEPHRAEVERVLAAQFHRPVPLRLVLDDEGAGAGADNPLDPASVVDEDVDLSELVDAPPGSELSGLERLTKAFPGAQLIDE